MKIVFIYDGDYPWDIRVEKIINSLKNNGYKVVLICRNRKMRKAFELINGVEIQRLPVFPRKLNSVLTFPFFLNPVWIYKIFITAKKGADLIIVRDLPLALTAIAIGKILRVPVIFDMAEPYPESLRSNWLYHKMKLTDYLVRNPFLADCLENIVLCLTNWLWVVSEESLERAVNKGYSKKKISIVGNTPVLKSSNILNKKTYPGGMSKVQGRFILIFVGFLFGDRGLDFAINAFKTVIAANPNIVMFIIGTGPIEKQLKNQVKELCLENDIIFEGWVSNEKVPEYLYSANVGILPFRSCAHINITLANKLFDYMAAGLPVLASSVKPMERILKETNAGMVFKHEDAVDFTTSVLSMATSTENNKILGENGINAIKSKYSWKYEEQRIFSSIKIFD